MRLVYLDISQMICILYNYIRSQHHTPTILDQKMLEMLYHPAIELNMNEKEAREVLEKRVES
ncbi:DUF2927 domain-containing protein [Pontibacillus yanchengensis]|uniref:DUF2927 domain-containing protein n=1 Tax=Pontibacillus yanchengensis TaxID=462910 RepID=A0A6I5A2P8_9BACI|nr:DUF2927 domain-containing protein [Pontibacillus yanchengensis]MYL32189.1 DUF2927 domain-containing protein [Pontibacillus yanchengensis]